MLPQLFVVLGFILRPLQLRMDPKSQPRQMQTASPRCSIPCFGTNNEIRDLGYNIADLTLRCYDTVPFRSFSARTQDHLWKDRSASPSCSAHPQSSIVRRSGKSSFPTVVY